MITILAPGAVEERFVREALAPLGVPVVSPPAEGPDGNQAAPILTVLWVGDTGDTIPPACADARRTILIVPPGYAAPGAEGDIVIARPLRPGLLTDRARTLLARAAGEALPARIALGLYEFYPRENTVHDKKTDKILKLTDKERDIILTLHAAAGKPVSRQDLLDSVWAYAPDVETHTLETHIYRLRQKIEPDPAAPSLILTDDAGYRMGVIEPRA